MKAAATLLITALLALPDVVSAETYVDAEIIAEFKQGAEEALNRGCQVDVGRLKPLKPSEQLVWVYTFEEAKAIRREDDAGSWVIADMSARVLKPLTTSLALGQMIKVRWTSLIRKGDGEPLGITLSPGESLLLIVKKQAGHYVVTQARRCDDD